MKNREKFREQFLEWAVTPGRDVCDFIRKEVLPNFGKEDGCDGINDEWCAILFILWLDEEYREPAKPEVDWDYVPVDTPVLVRNSKKTKTGRCDISNALETPQRLTNLKRGVMDRQVEQQMGLFRFGSTANWQRRYNV